LAFSDPLNLIRYLPNMNTCMHAIDG